MNKEEFHHICDLFVKRFQAPPTHLVMGGPTIYSHTLIGEIEVEGYRMRVVYPNLDESSNRSGSWRLADKRIRELRDWLKEWKEVREAEDVK